MATHPKTAVPGAVPGRKLKLPLSRLGEVYALAASGCTMQEIADGLGVNRWTLFKRRRKSPEFRYAIERGRAEFSASVKQGGVAYAHLLAARRAARAVEEQHEQAARLRVVRLELEALLAEAGPPPGPEASSATPQSQKRQPAPEAEAEPSYPWQGFGGARDVDRPDAGEALPLDDPLADWRD